MGTGTEDRKGKALTAVTIANGAALSGATEDTLGQTFVGLVVDGWTSAAMSFDVSVDGTTFFPMINADGEVTITDPNGVNSGEVYVSLDPADFAGVRKLKVRSGTVGSTTNQGAARSITPIVRAVS